MNPDPVKVTCFDIIKAIADLSDFLIEFNPPQNDREVQVAQLKAQIKGALEDIAAAEVYKRELAEYAIVTLCQRLGITLVELEDVVEDVEPDSTFEDVESVVVTEPVIKKKK